MSDEMRFSKTKVESEYDVNESENPSDFGYAKIVGIRRHLDSNPNFITSLTQTVMPIRKGTYLVV